MGGDHQSRLAGPLVPGERPMTAMPQVVDPAADERFRTLALGMGLDPDNIWVGGYVAYEWVHSRYVFQLACDSLEGAEVLEFGCNYGATAIILATLGAKVTAIDVNADYVNLAKANAARYGLADRIDFFHVADSTRLSFPDAQFRYITCNSVLEYVPPPLLPAVQGEIHRLLRPQGRLFILGTSNRLWPREVHSRRWFTNYLPRRLDGLLFPAGAPERGLFPWEILNGFNRIGRYANCDARDGGAVYVGARARMGMSNAKLGLLRVANQVLSGMGLSVGLITPSISLILDKIPDTN
jgi:SAM-dependent methyltransferase